MQIRELVRLLRKVNELVIVEIFERKGLIIHQMRLTKLIK